MSFFGNLNAGGIKGTDSVINGDGGSLLPISGAGLRFSSSQINKQQSLLSGLKPHEYGQGSASDDIAQQITPHKIQKIVPHLWLPSALSDVHNDIQLVHSVSDGDLAFTIRMVHDRSTRVKDYNFFAKQNITRAVDPIVNLATVNYILRGLQSNMGANSSNWASFLQSTGWPMADETYGLEDFSTGPHQHRNISMFVQDFIKPLGVVIGSDNQGGQHQGHSGGGGGVDFPVDHIVTVLVDGLCDNLVNLWRRTDVRAGDDLFLALCGYQVTSDDLVVGGHHATTPVKRSVGTLKHQFGQSGLNEKAYAPPSMHTKYTLNHWAKGTVEQRFTAPVNLLFELVPTTSFEIDEGMFLGDDRKNRGLWHIARSQVQVRCGTNVMSSDMQTFRNDKANLMGGGLLQATVAPVWKSACSVHASKKADSKKADSDKAPYKYKHHVPYVYHEKRHDDVNHATECVEGEVFIETPTETFLPEAKKAKTSDHFDAGSRVPSTKASVRPHYLPSKPSVARRAPSSTHPPTDAEVSPVKRAAESDGQQVAPKSKRAATGTAKRSVMEDEVYTDMDAGTDAGMDGGHDALASGGALARSLTTNSSTSSAVSVSSKPVAVAKVSAVSKKRSSGGDDVE